MTMRTNRLDTLIKSKMLRTVRNKRPPPVNLFFFLQSSFIHLIIMMPLLGEQSHPNKRPYSVSVIALLEFMCIEINRGSSSFYCSHVAPLKKKWPSSQSLNYCVHVSAQFLQTNEMFAAFAWLFVLTRKDVGTSSPFSISFLSFSNDYQSFTFHILLVVIKTASALSLITALFQISTSP